MEGETPDDTGFITTVRRLHRLEGVGTSIPSLSNGHFGVSFFGGTGEECWQFTEKSFCVKDDTLIRDGKAWASVALSDLWDLHLIMDHGSDQIEGYGRELELTMPSAGSVT
ncbi:MAG: hypothetical protein U1F77_13740 [Kiritimatiellia bacterium]